MYGILEGNELLVILLIVLVVFGGAKLPGLARSLGQAQREFQRARSDDEPKAANAEQTALAPGSDSAGS